MTEDADDTSEPGTHGDASDAAVRRDRFSGGPAREFLSSLAADERIFAADLAVDRAHVVMLAEQGIVGDDEAAEIFDALESVEDAGHAGLSAGEDVHEAIETAVIDRIGPTGGKMHTARSRNDEVATCLRYRLRTDLLDAIEATLALREALIETAAEHVDTVMPGYTHLQPAQPTTLAHYLLSYEQAVARDTQRLFDAYERVNRSPLGAAAFAGTPFDVDRERVADLLGFDAVLDNSMDAVSTRDFLAESTAALATAAVTVSGLAEDLIIFANKDYVDLSDDYASTSSIMPQKKNPDTLELARAVAGDAVGDLTGLMTTLKGLPRAYNRDLQRAHDHTFGVVDDVTEALDVAGGAVATADWNTDLLADEAAAGFSTATGVADLLAMAGLPFRTAHEIVAESAERAEGDTPDLATLDAAAETVIGESLFRHVSESRVQSALDPVESVASRDSAGGPAPAVVADSLDAATASIERDGRVVEATQLALTDTADALAAEVSGYE